MFATSTLLLPMIKLGMCPETIPWRRSVEKALEILEAMDESVVARKSVDLIKRYLREFSLSDAQSSMASIEGSVPAYAAETPSQSTFDIPVCDFHFTIESFWNLTTTWQEWAHGFGFPDCSFEGIARLFDDIGGLPMLDN